MPKMDQNTYLKMVEASLEYSDSLSVLMPMLDAFYKPEGIIWIDVNERLPELSQERKLILTYDKRGDNEVTSVEYYFREVPMDKGKEPYWKRCGITHWAELNKPIL